MPGFGNYHWRRERGILRAMGKRLKLLLLTLSFCSWVGPVWAEYTLILKNGRRITVQSYREEGRMIKFHSLGGEIGISKDQIQSIQKADPGELALDQSQRQGPSASQAPQRLVTVEEEKAVEIPRAASVTVALAGLVVVLLAPRLKS